MLDFLPVSVGVADKSVDYKKVCTLKISVENREATKVLTTFLARIVNLKNLFSIENFI